MDRRAIFFIGAAIACALLLPLTPDKYQWVGRDLSIAYVVLSVLSLLDHVSRTGSFRSKR